MTLCLEALTAADVEAPILVEIAATNGLNRISVFSAPLGGGRHDMVGDTPTRRETRDRCEALGIRIALFEGIALPPFATDEEVDDTQARLESAAWLGAEAVNVTTWTSPADRDAVGDEEIEARLLDRFHRFCDLAGEFELQVFTELSVRMALQTVPRGAAFVETLGRGVRLVIDALHFHRNDGDAAQIVAAAPWIGHCQLCDGPAFMPSELQREEALKSRLYPGEGDFPLIELVRALPLDVSLGIEVPRQDLIDAGVPAEARCRNAIEATKILLAVAGITR